MALFLAQRSYSANFLGSVSDNLLVILAIHDRFSFVPFGLIARHGPGLERLLQGKAVDDAIPTYFRFSR